MVEDRDEEGEEGGIVPVFMVEKVQSGIPVQVFASMKCCAVFPSLKLLHSQADCPPACYS